MKYSRMVEKMQLYPLYRRRVAKSPNLIQIASFTFRKLRRALDGVQLYVFTFETF